MSANETLLSVDSLVCRFGGLLAVDSLDMKVAEGEIHALIGPNGAGKSTVINLITGVYRPTAGTVGFRGHALTGELPSTIARLGVARTFQTIRIWKQMSLLENAMVGFQCRTRSGLLDVLLRSPRSRDDERKTREKALESLELVGLDRMAHRLAGSLSYGQQRLLELARAAATQPSLLLLDEPAAGMNPQEANTLVEILFQIRDRGIAILLIEHNMKLVMRAADRITVLSFGRKIAEGSPAEVRNDPGVIKAYLGQVEEEDAAA